MAVKDGPGEIGDGFQKVVPLHQYSIDTGDAAFPLAGPGPFQEIKIIFL
jgi:hypothetical protein